MNAYESLNPSNRIDDAAVVAVTWGDDTPSFYAIKSDHLAPYLAAVKAQGATAYIVRKDEAFELQQRHAWIGIQLCSIGGVAAWGRAILE